MNVPRDPKTDIPEDWTSPKWSEKLHREIVNQVFDHQKYRDMPFRRPLITQPMCSHKTRFKYTMIPKPESECYTPCAKEADYWHPISNKAYCREHIQDYMREIFYVGWIKLRLEIVYCRLLKAGLVK